MPTKKTGAAKRLEKPKKKPAGPRSFIPIRLPGKGNIPPDEMWEAVRKVREMELAGLIPGLPIPSPDPTSGHGPTPENGAMP